MKTELKLLIGVGVVLLLATIFMVVIFLNESDNRALYEYDISVLKNVPANKIGYDEIGEIKTGFKDFTAIAIAPDDTIYLAGDCQLNVYTKQRELDKIIDLNDKPSAVCVDELGMIYVGYKSSVVIFDGKGVKQFEVHDGLNKHSVITSIAVRESDFLVADAGNRVVNLYNKLGELVNVIGKKNIERSVPGFIVPSPIFDVAVGRGGAIWIVDPGRHSLNNFTESGDVVSSWATASMTLEGFCGCCNPTDIAILPTGSFITAEKGLVRVKEYSPVGEFVSVVAEPAKFQDDTEGLDLAVDSMGYVYVVDTASRKVRIFKKRGVDEI